MKPNTGGRCRAQPQRRNTAARDSRPVALRDCRAGPQWARWVGTRKRARSAERCAARGLIRPAVCYSRISSARARCRRRRMSGNLPHPRRAAYLARPQLKPARHDPRGQGRSSRRDHRVPIGARRRNLRTAKIRSGSCGGHRHVVIRIGWARFGGSRIALFVRRFYISRREVIADRVLATYRAKCEADVDDIDTNWQSAASASSPPSGARAARSGTAARRTAGKAAPAPRHHMNGDHRDENSGSALLPGWAPTDGRHARRRFCMIGRFWIRHVCPWTCRPRSARNTRRD